jgi:hypothetical protein
MGFKKLFKTINIWIIIFFLKLISFNCKLNNKGDVKYFGKLSKIILFLFGVRSI